MRQQLLSASKYSQAPPSALSIYANRRLSKGTDTAGFSSGSFPELDFPTSHKLPSSDVLLDCLPTPDVPPYQPDAQHKRTHSVVRRLDSAPADSTAPGGGRPLSLTDRQCNVDLQSTKRLESLGWKILRMQGDQESISERSIRESMGNNPDTSKALRRLFLEGMLVRTGSGGRCNPYLYSVTLKGKEALDTARNP